MRISAKADYAVRATLELSISPAGSPVKGTKLAEAQETHARMARAGTAEIRQRMRVVRWELMAPLESAAKRARVNGESLGPSFRVAPRIRQPEALVTAALAMAEHAATHRDAFVVQGFPSDFTETLRAGAMALRGAVDARAHELARRAAVTAELSAAVKEGRAFVSIAEGLLTTALDEDPVLAAEWKSVARGRGKRRVRAE